MKLKVSITAIILMSAGYLFSTFAQEVEPEIPAPPEPVVKVGEAGKVLYSYFRMSEEEEREALEKLKPELRAQLKLIKENNEHRYYELLREYSFRGLRLPRVLRDGRKLEMQENKTLEYEIAVEALAAKFRKAGADEKVKIKKDLEQNLSFLFDLKEKDREEEVEELEQRLDELKKKMTMRKENKSVIIQRRMEELLGEDKYLEWE